MRGARKARPLLWLQTVTTSCSAASCVRIDIERTSAPANGHDVPVRDETLGYSKPKVKGSWCAVPQSFWRATTHPCLAHHVARQPRHNSCWARWGMQHEDTFNKWVEQGRVPEGRAFPGKAPLQCSTAARGSKGAHPMRQVDAAKVGKIIKNASGCDPSHVSSHACALTSTTTHSPMCMPDKCQCCVWIGLAS